MPRPLIPRAKRCNRALFRAGPYSRTWGRLVDITPAPPHPSASVAWPDRRSGRKARECPCGSMRGRWTRPFAHTEYRRWQLAAFLLRLSLGAWRHTMPRSRGFAPAAVRAGAIGMPIISTFFGIVIRMFYQEHEPPHFHAEYQGQQAKFDFHGEILAGEMRSGTARRLIREWASQHAPELEANWTRMKAGKPLERIPPLE